MTCGFLGVQTLGTETLNLRVTILLDTKFVRLLRSQAAALNDKVRNQFYMNLLQLLNNLNN